MKTSLFLGAALSMALAGAALAQNMDSKMSATPPKPGTNTNAVSAVEDATSAVVGKVSAEMTSTAKGFVNAAAMSDMYEVEAGKIAATRATDPKLKDFANQMVTAHTGTTASLKAILATNKVATPPAKLDARHQGLINNLTGANAADFDTRYIGQQVAAHSEALTLMQGYAKDGDNAALKKFAADTAPKVQSHLTMIKQIQAAHDAMKKNGGTMKTDGNTRM